MGKGKDKFTMSVYKLCPVGFKEGFIFEALAFETVSVVVASIHDAVFIIHKVCKFRI